MVYGVLHDPVLLSKLEADFRQYYHFSVRELFDPDSPVTLREVYELTRELPVESRFMKYLSDDLFSPQDHMAANTNDALQNISFQLGILASGTVGGKEYRKAMQDAPKPMERPTVVEKAEKPKPKFVTGRELAELLSKR